MEDYNDRKGTLAGGRNRDDAVQTDWHIAKAAVFCEHGLGDGRITQVVLHHIWQANGLAICR